MTPVSIYVLFATFCQLTDGGQLECEALPQLDKMYLTGQQCTDELYKTNGTNKPAAPRYGPKPPFDDGVYHYTAELPLGWTLSCEERLASDGQPQMYYYRRP